MASLRDVADFFIAMAQDIAEMNLGDAMTNLRLQKMLYFAQGWMITRHGKPLFSDSIEAWQLGPVVPTCYNWYKGSGKNQLSADMSPRNAFTNEEYELLLDTWNELSKYSTSQLVSMTHEVGTPWDTVWNHSRERVITNEQIREFFENKNLPSFKEKLNSIPTVKPIYRENGIPVFSNREVWKE